MNPVNRGVALGMIQGSPPPPLGRRNIPISTPILVVICGKYVKLYGKYEEIRGSHVEYKLERCINEPTSAKRISS